MRSCGRIRKEIGQGWTQLTHAELKNLEMGALRLEASERHTFHTRDREYAAVLIQGECQVELKSGLSGRLGPRQNPFEDLPYGLIVSRAESVLFSARSKCMLGIASSPAPNKLANKLVTADEVDTTVRGAGNWTRQVRKVCWSDNTQGNMLLAGETCTPSGNWSTVPPHRHQYDVVGKEAPYEEIYFFQFSTPQGYGLLWQFDDEGEMDQAFSLKTNDLIYHNQGYHPLVCGPGATLYHLTFMAGPRRESQASIHPHYGHILEESNLENQYTPQ